MSKLSQLDFTVFFQGDINSNLHMQTSFLKAKELVIEAIISKYHGLEFVSDMHSSHPPHYSVGQIISFWVNYFIS